MLQFFHTYEPCLGANTAGIAHASTKGFRQRFPRHRGNGWTRMLFMRSKRNASGERREIGSRRGETKQKAHRNKGTNHYNSNLVPNPVGSKLFEARISGRLTSDLLLVLRGI